MSDKPMTAYFFGVTPGSSAGHFLHEPGPGAPHRAADGPVTPWGHGHYRIGELTALRSAFDPDGRDRDWKYGTNTKITQTEGEPGFAGQDGWTLVALWDRSGDRRGGCCALFTFNMDLDDASALALAKRLFPAVFARIEAHIGRPVVVPTPRPARCPTCRQPIGGTT